MIDFSKVRDQMISQGFKFPEPFSIQIADAKEILMQAMGYFLPGFKWLPEYEHVASWLSDNKNKGLLLYGANGRGKTKLSKMIIPAIFMAKKRLVLKAYDAYQMNTDLDEILKKRLVSLDDVGTEDVRIVFGEKRFAFPEIMDMAEKRGNLVVISTNSDADQLAAKYGIRTLERLKSMCYRVNFNGESLRS